VGAIEEKRAGFDPAFFFFWGCFLVFVWAVAPFFVEKKVLHWATIGWNLQIFCFLLVVFYNKRMVFLVIIMNFL
jgi:hypothetical protein